MLLRTGFVGRVGQLGSRIADFPWNASTGSLPSGSAFTRASNGTLINASLGVEEVGSNVARFTHVGGEKYLLMEAAATNLVISSQDLRTNAAGNPLSVWTASGATTASTSDASPISSVNWTQWTFTGAFNYIRQAFSITANAVYSESFFIRKTSTLRKMRFDFCDTVTSDRVSAIVDLDAGTAVAQKSGSGANESASIVDVGTYYIVTLSGSINETTGCFQITNATYGAGAIDIVGAQLELSSKSTSYIFTTTAAATRAEDFWTPPIPAWEYTNFQRYSRYLTLWGFGTTGVTTEAAHTNVSGASTTSMMDFSSAFQFRTDGTSSPTAVADQDVCAWAIFEAGTLDKIRLQFGDQTSTPSFRAEFNFTLETVTSSSNSAGATLSASRITDRGDGTYLCEIVGQINQDQGAILITNANLGSGTIYVHATGTNLGTVARVPDLTKNLLNITFDDDTEQLLMVDPGDKLYASLLNRPLIKSASLT